MSRNIKIKGKSKVTGAIRVPGDKSLSHRIAMLSAIANGASRISGFASSVDCWATVDCVKRLGIQVEVDNEGLTIYGKGLRGLSSTEQSAGRPVRLSVGNSGSTIRMISGLLAGQNLVSQLDGDDSIRRRPMRRIIEPLRRMGAKINGRDENYAPLIIHGNRLTAIDYESPVASAQVKSCVLFAGLLAEGRTSVREPAASRNHSELMLKEFGAGIEVSEARTEVSVEGGRELRPLEYQVPGDVSSAAFFVAAATILPDSLLIIRGVNLNESRTAFLDVLENLGARICRTNLSMRHGEPVGDLEVESCKLHSSGSATVLSGSIIPNLIDEIPILAVVATQLNGRLEVRDAEELRVKESDRVQAVVAGLRAMGGRIEEFEDGFAIEGPQTLSPARIETYGDHRIAMAFSIAGLLAEGVTEVVEADCAEVSFPEFFDLLRQTAGDGVIE